MSNQYAVYKRFNDEGLAKEYFGLLTKHGLDAKLVDNSPGVDITFSGATQFDQTEVYLRQSEFEQADQLLADKADVSIADVDKDYYLFEFSTDELYEIIMKPDEWGEFDYSLSQKILAQRGHVIDDEQLSALKKARIDDLSEPDKDQKPWVYAGYFFSFFGGAVGILIGYYLWQSKKTLPDGRKVHAYTEEDQGHGRVIFFMGVLVLVFWIGKRIVYGD